MTTFGNDNAVSVEFGVLCVMLVFFMQIGFLAVEVGVSSRSYMLDISLKNFLDIIFSTISFSTLGCLWIGGLYVADTCRFYWESGDLSGQNVLKFLLYICFSASAATIVSGAMAGRTKTSAHVMISVLICGLVTPHLFASTWEDDGVLARYGFIDVAGGVVVHVSAAVVSFFGCGVLGPRFSRQQQEPQYCVHSFCGYSYVRRALLPRPASSNVMLVVLGTLFLWYGWFAFNAGSARSQSGVALALLNTLLGGACSGALYTSLKMYSGERYPLGEACNVVLAGLASVTSCCTTVDPWAAVLCSVLAVPFYYVVADLVERVGIDDTVKATAVHSAGAIGVLMNGLAQRADYLRAEKYVHARPGLFFSGDFRPLLTQVGGLLGVVVATAAVTWPSVVIMSKRGWLRYSTQTEVLGIDLHTIEDRVEETKPTTRA